MKKILRLLYKLLKKVDIHFFGGKLFRKRDLWAISIADKYPSLEYSFLRNGTPYMSSSGEIRFTWLTELAPSDLIWLQYNNPICDALHGRYDIVKTYCAYKEDKLKLTTMPIGEVFNINQNGVLLDGVEEVVKAFLAGQEKLPVRVNYIANIPIQYNMMNGENILYANSLGDEENVIYKKEMLDLLQSCQTTFYFFIWPPAMKYKKELLRELQTYEDLTILNQYELSLTESELSSLIENAYNGADKEQQIVQAKKQIIIDASTPHDGQYPICVLTAYVKNPCYHFHARTGCLISQTLDEIKRNLRSKWAPMINNYSYDNIIHSTDNSLQNSQMDLTIDSIIHKQKLGTR